jgi:hypothetical protein
MEKIQGKSLNSKKMKHDSQEFYKALGHLFYSIASVDKNITYAEADALTRCVNAVWVPYEETASPSGTMAYYIIVWFEYLRKQQTLPLSSWEFFKEYYRSHSTEFTPVIKERIETTARKVAGTTAAINKTELISLFQLKAILNN